MRVFVVASDTHRHLLSGFAELFNRFWEGQAVEVLGYRPPTDLPSNFEFVSLGRQEDFPPGAWTDGLIPFMEGVRENSFVLVLEDQFLIGPVDRRGLSFAEQAVEAGADKVQLFSSPGKGQMAHSSSDWNVLLDRVYRTSLSPAVWSKEYFRRFLTPGISPWRMDNHPDSWPQDRSLVLLPKRGAIYPFVDVYRRGAEYDDTFRRVSAGVRYGDADWQVLSEEAVDVMRRFA